MRLPQLRVSSPAPGGSSLITSAPRSASVIVHHGPASTRDRSSTRTPVSGVFPVFSAIDFLLLPAGYHPADIGIASPLLYNSGMADDSKMEAAFEELEIRMLEIQQAYHRQGQRAILAFEGTDAAGKGGTIKRLVEKLDPRGIKVWPIGPPSADEHGRHYLYRFWARLPEPGTIAIFDRSWYGRVLVERIDGLTPKPAWKRAYREINEFERMLTDDGVRVVKLFL